MRARLAVEPLEVRDVPASFESLPVMPFGDPAALDHARAIFARGQLLGRRLDTFARLGDSNSSTYAIFGTETFPYLNPLGEPGYDPAGTNLAARYPALLDTWKVYYDALNAAGQNSFAWIGPGAWGGWSTQHVLDAVGAVVATSNPAVALVMIGTNEVPFLDAAGFRSRLTQVVDALCDRGIVPVLSTVPPYLWLGGMFQSSVTVVNQIISEVAAVGRVPLWNFWRVSVGLPNQGLGGDEYGVHLSASPNGGGSFHPVDLLFAQNVRNLQALQILDWFRETVAGGPAFVAPNPVWQAMADNRSFYAVGRDVGFSPTVDVYDATTAERVNRFLAFESSFGGSVRVATGDVNGDGFTDVVCATGAGAVARVRVFSGKDGSVLANRVPFGVGYTSGLSVAVGDLEADGIAEVVVGKSAGSTGVRVYHGDDFTLVSAFRAFPGMSGGVSVAVANVSTFGPVVAVASAANPVVRLFDATGTLDSSFRVFAGAGFGLSLAAADLDGDHFDELAVSPTIGSRIVYVLNGTTHATVATFTVGPIVDPAFGIRLGTLRTPMATDTLLVGNGPGSAVSLRGFDDLSGIPIKLAPTTARRAYGIFVG
jgi:hypothetical protein